MRNFFILVLFIFALAIPTYANTQSLTQCISTPADNTEYLLSENFNFDSSLCFDVRNTNGVTINGQNHTYDLGGNIYYILMDNTNDLILKDFRATNGNFYIRTQNTNGDVSVDNTNIEYTRDLGTRDAVGLFFMVSGTTNDVTITNSKFVNRASLTQHSGENAHAIFTMQSGSQKTDYNHVSISNSEFINFEFSYNDFNTNNINQISVFDSVITHVNQDSFMRNLNFPNACSNYVFNNVMTSIFDLQDSDMNGLSDTTESYTFDSCTLFSGNQITYLNGNSPFSQDVTYFNSPLYFVPANTFGNEFYLTKSLSLDGADVINLEGTQNSRLNLEAGLNSGILTLTNVRAIRLGSNNEMYGGDDLNLKPQVNTAGTITNIYSGLYNSNWHLIEYDNSITINNIDFNLNAVDNYGLLRKRESGTDGINVDFKNNILDLNFNPSSLDIPMIVIGSFANIQNNVFDLSSSQNISLFQGGLSNAVSGGHIIQDNTFIGGGHVFAKLSDTTIDANRFDTSIIHNEFLQQGSGLYAVPLNPTEDNFNLLLNPNLNSTYFYQTTCTNYQFNLGNYYQDWFDSGFYNDTNGDGIHDGFNGFDFINRGTDVLGNEINDFRSVIPYPYDFLSNIGNAEATFDTCQSFNFNIIEPQEQNYSSGHTLVSDWEFISIAYDNMVCFETLNGFTSIYENVESGDNKGLEYDTTDGKGFFQVKCCDTEQCNNIVQESDIIEFNIGDGSLGALVVQGAETPAPILGCTDSSATNYNPNATQDDGSCTYDNGGGDNGGNNGGNNGGSSNLGGSFINTDSASVSVDNTIGILDNFVQFIFYIGIPILILLVIAGIGIFFAKVVS